MEKVTAGLFELYEKLLHESSTISSEAVEGLFKGIEIFETMLPGMKYQLSSTISEKRLHIKAQSEPDWSEAKEKLRGVKF